MKHVNALLFAVLLISGCDSGVQGPRGPEGPQGPEGPPGQIAATVFTGTYSVVDIVIDPNDGALAYADFDVPELTAAVVDNGIVLAYINSDALDQWVALPFTIAYDDNQDGGNLNVNEVVQVTYAYTYDLFSIVFTSSFNQIDVEGLPEGPVKVVLIPGELVGKVKGKNLSSAEEIQRALGIRF
jgi:hypothetical protein